MPVDVARIAFAQQEYRITPAIEDLSVKTRHPLAGEAEFPTLIRTLSDADALGVIILGLRKLDRWTWACFVEKRNYSPFEVGTTVRLTYPRFGFDAGQNFIVKRTRTDSNAMFDELTLFGPEDTSGIVLPPPPPSGGFLTLENGLGSVLLEDGSKLLLE